MNPSFRARETLLRRLDRFTTIHHQRRQRTATLKDHRQNCPHNAQISYYRRTWPLVPTIAMSKYVPPHRRNKAPSSSSTTSSTGNSRFAAVRDIPEPRRNSRNNPHSSRDNSWSSPSSFRRGGSQHQDRHRHQKVTQDWVVPYRLFRRMICYDCHFRLPITVKWPKERQHHWAVLPHPCTPTSKRWSPHYLHSSRIKRNCCLPVTLEVEI